MKLYLYLYPANHLKFGHRLLGLTPTVNP